MLNTAMVVSKVPSITAKTKTNSQIFRELAEKMNIDLSIATRRAAKASSAGIDTRIPENMEKVIRGDFEKLYDIKLPRERCIRGIGNMVAHYAQVHKRAFSVNA